MKKQLVVTLLLLATGIAHGALSDVEYEQPSADSILHQHKVAGVPVFLELVYDGVGPRYRTEAAFKNLRSIDAILAEENNFHAAPGTSLESIVENLNTAKSCYQRGETRIASLFLMDAKNKGDSVSVDIPERGTYNLGQMIAAIFSDDDPFAPTIK